MRPSSLPILAQSPKFVSGTTEFAESGRDRHEALRAHFAGDDSLLNLLDDEEADAVRWAADYIRLKAPMSDYPIEFECKLPILYPDFSEQCGHLDAVCHLDIFDLKWRVRDYDAQMAAYALAVLQHLNIVYHDGDISKMRAGQPIGTVRVHQLFGAVKRVEVLTFDEETANKVIEEIIADVNSAPECRPSDYCGWCANRVSCDVLNKRAQTIGAGREDWQLEQYHASQIEKPEEMAKALKLADHVEEWVKAVKFRAEQMAIKDGLKIPGYELRPGNSKRYVTDVAGAFNASGLEAKDFLACCQVRFTSDKKDPNKPGLENVYHKATNAPSLAAAKRELKQKIADFVVKPEPKLKLKPIKGSVKDEEAETE